MRTITDHIVEGDPAPQLKIEVTDEPGAGGACHHYMITGFTFSGNDQDIPLGLHIRFQDGPIKEAGVNGITQEALLAIVIDRLRSFQAGPYPSSFNARALYCCEEALGSLKARTQDRLPRDVEGKTQA